MAIGALALAAPAGAAAAKRADLAVKPPSSARTAATAGETVEVAVPVRNAGKAKSRKAAVWVYLSADEKLDASDAISSSAPVRGLKPRKRSKVVVPLEVSGAAPAGVYSIIACAEPAAKARDARRKNDCATSGATLDVAKLPETAPTSAGLIEGAYRNGEITREQALTYRVFAIFGDPRLPARFASAVPGEDHSALLEAQLAWETFSAETQRALAEYLGNVPPGSGRRPFAKGPDKSPNLWDLCTLHDTLPGREPKQWESVQNEYVKVWFRKGGAPMTRATDRVMAGTILRESDTFWPKLLEVGMGPPKPDGGSRLACRGGDDRIDITIMAGSEFGANGLAEPYGRGRSGKLPPCPATSHILLSRSLAANSGRIGPVAAHELFHAIQWGYSRESCQTVQTGIEEGTDPSAWRYHGLWLFESTAKFMEHHAYPHRNTEHPHGVTLTLDPERPIFTPEDPEYDAVSKAWDYGRSRLYGGYLLWLYLAEAGRGLAPIKATFDGVAGAGDVAAFTRALDAAAGPFEEVWPKFSLALLNAEEAPHEPYRADNFTAGANTRLFGGRLPEDQQSFEQPLYHGTQLRGPSATYYWVTVPQRARHIEFLDPPEQDGVTIQAIPKIQETWQNPAEPRVWDEDQEFCRDDSTQELNAVILIASNSDLSGEPVDLGADNTRFKWSTKCPSYLEGRLEFSVSEQRSVSGSFATNSSFDKRATLDLSLDRNPDPDDTTHEWLPTKEARATWSGTGTSRTTRDSHSCVIDSNYTWSGAAPEWSDHFTFYEDVDGKAQFSTSIFGHERRETTVTGEPSCGDSGVEESENGLIQPDCQDGVITRDAQGKVKVVFDHTETDTYSGTFSGSVTKTCKGTLIQK